MREELEEGKAKSMHNLDLLLRCPWPKGGTNLTRFGGCSFIPLRDTSFHCCSLWFSVPKTKCMRCASPPANHPPPAISDTLAHSHPSPRGAQPLCFMTHRYIWHASDHRKSFWEGLTLQSWKPAFRNGCKVKTIPNMLSKTSV